MVVDWGGVIVLYCFSVLFALMYRDIKVDFEGNKTAKMDPRYPNETGFHALVWILIISLTWPIGLLWYGLKRIYAMLPNTWNWLTNSP